MSTRSPVFVSMLDLEGLVRRMAANEFLSARAAEEMLCLMRNLTCHCLSCQAARVPEEVEGGDELPF